MCNLKLTGHVVRPLPLQPIIWLASEEPIDDWSFLSGKRVTITSASFPNGIEYRTIDVHPMPMGKDVLVTLEPADSWNRRMIDRHLGQSEACDRRAWDRLCFDLLDGALVLSRTAVGYFCAA